jgi:hypothetical protein
LAFDHEAGKRKLNPDAPVTTEVAQTILPIFKELDQRHAQAPIATEKYVGEHLAMAPSEVSAMVIHLSFIAETEIK